MLTAMSFGILVINGLTAGPLAHPLAPRTFDRAIQVVVLPDAIEIMYELGVNELTLATELLALVEPGQVPAEPAAAFALYRDQIAPILGRGLVVDADGTELPLRLERSEFERRDHVRFTFRYRAAWSLANPKRRVTVHETNFTAERGYVRIALKGRRGVQVDQSTKPAIVERIPLRATWEMSPEEEESSRFVRAIVHGNDAPASSAQSPNDAKSQIATGSQPFTQNDSVSPAIAEDDALADHRLRDLLSASDEGLLWWLMMLPAAFVLGCVHAIKPGHGKTMVAAYLIGEQGTVGHALVLGLVTTLTHTGSVLFVALVLGSFAGSNVIDSRALGFWLTLLSGILIVGFGLTLLRRRIRGGDDILHVHGPGGHVHLPDGTIRSIPGSDAPPGDHLGQPYHHSSRHDVSEVTAGRLVTLGVSGGLVPCDDAVLLLVAAVGAGLLSHAVYILLAFSAGLATVLVSIGILVVKVRGFADRRVASSNWPRRLQVASACLITLIGILLCVQATFAS